jgi:hypothetical protein
MNYGIVAVGRVLGPANGDTATTTLRQDQAYALSDRTVLTVGAEWRAVASWSWNVKEDEELCGICRHAYDACCPDCRIPGDDCPLSARLYGDVF